MDTTTQRPLPDDPLVSVVVPVFDAEPYLRESLESILGQTHRRLEVIVMDDASGDRSVEIASELAESDSRLRVQRRSANVGQFANVNAGLELARGELLAVYHADDVYHPEIVEREVAFLRAHPEAGAVFTQAVLVDADGHEFGRLDRVPAELGDAALLDYPLLLNAILGDARFLLPTTSALVRRSVYAEHGAYSIDYGLRGDLELWLRIARHHPLGLLREPLLRYRVGDHNESRRYAHLRTEPDLLYRVLDERLAAGDRSLVEPRALGAYEARRAADLVFAAGNAYALGRRAQVRALLRHARPDRLARTRSLRPLVLYALLHVLGRLPHSVAVGRRLRKPRPV